MAKTTRAFQCSDCGKSYDLSFEQADFDSFKHGDVLIQNALPYLTEDERELLISGICGACFDKLFEDDGLEIEDGEEGVAF